MGCQKIYNILTNNIETPILFLIFNRPDNARQVFSQIRKMKPRRAVYNHRRPRFPKEKALCEKARETVSPIDWG